MVTRRYFRGLAFVVLILSAVLISMAAAPSITVTNPANPATVNVNYVNVTVTTDATGLVYLNWMGANTTMDGSVPNLYKNVTPLANNVYTYRIYANDTTPENWTVTLPRTVTVNVPASSPTIVTSNPPSSFTSYVGSPVEFNITTDQVVTTEWTIDSVLQPNTTSGTSFSSYINGSAGIGTYTVKANASNSSGYNVTIWTWTVAAPLGPDPVSGLTATRGTTWINWTWTNPTVNFNHTIVTINGTFQANTTEGYFNHTLLNPGMAYRISLQNVDDIGATSSVVTNQTYTQNTPAGPDVSVPLTSSLTVIFSQVNTEGNTTVSISPTNLWGAHSFSNIGSYYDIATGATPAPSSHITVELTYNPAGIFNESTVKLYHWNGASWDDITTSLDTTNHKVRGNVTSLSPFVVGAPPIPSIIKDPPNTGTNVETIGNQPATFSAHSDQLVNITWKLDGALKFDNGSMSPGDISTYTVTSTTGAHNISVTATNITTGSINIAYWNWTVRPKTYETGDRVWDGSKDMSLTYKWNPMSFYAFYYDVDSNVGNETLTISLSNKIERNIGSGKLTYATFPENVSFKYKPWGYYNVIGFMAEKYFAAYTSSTSPEITDRQVSTLNSKQLHKILMDDNTQRAVYTGSTLTLSEGYVLKVKDVDVTGGKIVLLSLLKDGGEVDTGTVQAGSTYVFYKRVGTVSDLPVIAVHVENVFAGRESNAAFLKGIFQISESFTSVNTDNKYGVMQITDASEGGIFMENKNSFTLAPGTTIDVMGDIKFKVADNSSVLRFAPMVKKTGTYEVRGTIAQDNDTTFDWTPMNFEGFYYDINEDIGSEKLSLTRSSRTVGIDQLIYTSTPQSVSFKYKNFGSYNVIGFMAEKYFAGYTEQTSTDITGRSLPTAISTISYKQLQKVLIDDNTQKPVYAGSTLTLGEGYVLKVKDVDVTGGKIVLLTLLKDGNEVDPGTTIYAGGTYTFVKKVGSVNDLPIIAVHIETVFAGREANAAFVKGVFQISESPTPLAQGDRFGAMEVNEVSDVQIEMTNPSTMTLSQGSTVDVMGNIKFKVADDAGAVRFYPYILANGSNIAANQLALDVPATPMVRDTITINVTAGNGIPVDGAEVSFDNIVIGTTNNTGKLDYILTRSGLHTITATKLGYDKAIRTIQISEYVDTRLSLDIPPIFDQGIPVSIKVLSNGSTIPGANITFDGAVIGTTDLSGILKYNFTVSGTHNLGASKFGYISVVREVAIRMPFTEYKALDINFTPPVVFTNQKFKVWANVTNVGTKGDMLPVSLIINNTIVDSTNVTLAPGEIMEVNFTREEDLPPGNYTVELLGQKKVMEVQEAPLNLLLIGAIMTVLLGIIIYVATSKNRAGLDLEAIKRKLNIEAVKDMLVKPGPRRKF